ncbi:RNA ligase family protein [Streptomyces sp. AM8-1-1]|uniref:ATP-dependent DNA ligase n=1 Tax=Streptomyces sp. AM8-1-1 TaxID=3075825 RepID=UPI0028C4F6DD|nr:RNA ligase family protein [Streptomyces sp. AM8-1-1]WNO76857.1 RNA ligase family protein [Streptomyces sp. AM8-1-1]
MVFEPKYDGYRMLVFAHGGEVFLQSRNLRDLTRAFPEIAEAAAALGEDVVLDGEVVIHTGGSLDFSALQQRLNRHPSTAVRLAVEQPAHFIAFDMLEHAGTDMLSWPFAERRAALESFFQRHALHAPWQLTPATTDRDLAEQWLTEWGGLGVEGVVAKGAQQPYLAGQRRWFKIRARDTAEAIVGAVTGPITRPNTLLVGRYTRGGRLRLVARSTPLSLSLRDEIGRLTTPTGPEHPWWGMRLTVAWGSREPLSFTCVAPELVVEFLGDTAIDSGRWRHAVWVQRTRPDLAPGDIPTID